MKKGRSPERGGAPFLPASQQAEELLVEASTSAFFVVVKLKHLIVIQSLHHAPKLALHIAVAGLDRGGFSEVAQRLHEIGNAARPNEFEFLKVENDLLGDLVGMCLIGKLVQVFAQRLLDLVVQLTAHADYHRVTDFLDLRLDRHALQSSSTVNRSILL